MKLNEQLPRMAAPKKMLPTLSAGQIGLSGS
jgi:hypothetical protein